MPAADFSSYHQNQSTTSDGNKFNNMIDSIQVAVNGLDNANIAAAAGIVASKIAVAGLPGYEIGYDELTAGVTGVVATTAGTAATVKTSSSYTFDGAAVMVEFFAPEVINNTTGANCFLELFQDATDLGTIAGITPGGTSGAIPVLSRRKVTPSAGAHTFTVKLFVSTGTGSVQAGVGGAGVLLPGYIRITKV